jgi:hypothetical protein
VINLSIVGCKNVKKEQRKGIVEVRNLLMNFLKKYKWMLLIAIIISIIFGIIYSSNDIQQYQGGILIFSFPLFFISGALCELLNTSEKIVKLGMKLILLAIFELILFAIIWSNYIFYYDPQFAILVLLELLFISFISMNLVGGFFIFILRKITKKSKRISIMLIIMLLILCQSPIVQADQLLIEKNGPIDDGSWILSQGHVIVQKFTTIPTQDTITKVSMYSYATPSSEIYIGLSKSLSANPANWLYSDHYFVYTYGSQWFSCDGFNYSCSPSDFYYILLLKSSSTGIIETEFDDENLYSGGFVIYYDGINWNSQPEGVDVNFRVYGDELQNHAPNEPNNPIPTSASTDVSITIDLSWSGGDPDPGDIVTYDVYFGTTNPPPKIVSNQSGTTYDPGTLNYNTFYLWRIRAWDNHGASTWSYMVWYFTTESENNQPIAYIDSISPNPSTKGQNITFTGHGSDNDGSIIGYQWSSNIDGILSTTNSFTTSTLSGGTHTIYFKVKDNDNVWSDEVSSTVWINFTFVHITDPHVRGYNYGYEFYPDQRWNNIISVIRSWNPAPEFVVCSGDLVENDVVFNFQALMNPLFETGNTFYVDDTFKIPIYFCPGNHDARYQYYPIPPLQSFDSYHNYIGPDYYHILNKNCAIFSLNSGFDEINPLNFIGDLGIPEGNGIYNNEMSQLSWDLDWLDNQPSGSDSSDYIKIVTMHHPFQSILPKERDGSFNVNRDYFNTTCQNYKVNITLSGHIHNYASFLNRYGNPWNKGDGTMFVMTSAIAEDL